MEKSLSLMTLARYEEARRRRGVFLIMMGIIPGRDDISFEDYQGMVDGPDTDHLREQLAALSEPEKERVELLRFAMETKYRERKKPWSKGM